MNEPQEKPHSQEGIELRVSRELADLTGLALLGEQRLRSVMVESLPDCPEDMTNWADGWIVEPKRNTRLGLLPRRFSPLPVKSNRIKVVARGPNVELTFEFQSARMTEDHRQGDEAVLFVRPECGRGLATLEAFEILAAASWPNGLQPRAGVGPLWDEPWAGPVDFAPILWQPYHGRFLRLPFALLTQALSENASVPVTVGREFAPMLAEQLAHSVFVNGTLLGNRRLDRIDPSGFDGDITLDGAAPLVVRCEDTAGQTLVDQRYAPRGTDPLRTFRIEPSGRMVFHPDAHLVPGRLSVAYLQHLPWPDGFYVDPGTMFERNRKPIFRAVTGVVPEGVSPGANLREGAIWLLSRPPVRYPSRSELRRAAFEAFPAPLRAWIEIDLDAPVRVEARRDTETGFAVPTWVIRLHPRPDAIAEKVDRFFEGVAHRLRNQFGDLPIRLEWEECHDG